MDKKIIFFLFLRAHLLAGTYALWFSLEICLDIHNLLEVLDLAVRGIYQLLVTIQPAEVAILWSMQIYFHEKGNMNKIVIQSGSI